MGLYGLYIIDIDERTGKACQCQDITDRAFGLIFPQPRGTFTEWLYLDGILLPCEVEALAEEKYAKRIRS
jgi:hypothetical protein